jgi:hypothetical protein
VTGRSTGISTSQPTFGYGGSGIGTGHAQDWGNSRIENLVLENANVSGSSTASPDYGGSGIGTGSAYAASRTGSTANSGIGNLTINNVNVTGTSSTSGSHGGSGIGTGAVNEGGDTAIGLLILSGALTIICDLLRVPNVSVSGASIFTSNAKVFGTTPTLSGWGLSIFYATGATTARETSLSGFPSVAIGNLSLAYEGGWRFCLSGRDCSAYEFRHFEGLFILVPDAGSYSIVAEGPSRGFLGPSEGSNAFPVPNASFFPVAYFTFIPASTPPPTPTPTGAFIASAPLPISSPIAKSFWPADSDRHRESQLPATAAHGSSDRFSSSATADKSGLAATAAYADSHRFDSSVHLDESTLAPTAAPAGSDPFISSANPDESQLAATAAHADSDRFNSSVNLDESWFAATAAYADSDRFISSANLNAARLAESSTLSPGVLVGIVFAAVGAVVLVVGLIAWRHCRVGSKAADGLVQPLGDADTEYESRYQTGAFVTMVNPDVGDLSDELADEVFD